MGSYSVSNTLQRFSAWTQTPARRSTDNLESFLISRNYTEGLIVLRSPWKWNMLHRGPDGKGYCLPFIHNWEILNVKPVGENATEATEHLTTKLHSIVSTLSQPAERNMCYVVYQTARRRCTLTGSVFKSAFPNCCSLFTASFFTDLT